MDLQWNSSGLCWINMDFLVNYSGFQWIILDDGGFIMDDGGAMMDYDGKLGELFTSMTLWMGYKLVHFF